MVTILLTLWYIFQIDCVALYLIFLVQMIQSGLQVSVYTIDTVIHMIQLQAKSYA